MLKHFVRLMNSRQFAALAMSFVLVMVLGGSVSIVLLVLGMAPPALAGGLSLVAASLLALLAASLTYGWDPAWKGLLMALALLAVCALLLWFVTTQLNVRTL